MDRYVVIQDGRAVNIVLWDGKSEWTPPEGCTLAKESSKEGQAALAAAGE